MAVDIKKLYNYNRLLEVTYKQLCFYLYIPIGICLALIRLVLGSLIILLGFTLPNYKFFHDILHKGLCFTFGITVNINNYDRTKVESVESYISNHVSIFDHIAIHAATNAVMPGMILTPLLSSIFGTRHFGTRSNFSEFKRNIADFLNKSNTSLYFQPEGITTNGKAVLKFTTWPFLLVNRVQPVAILINRPILDIAVSTIHATYWTDLFFFMFSPYTVFNICFLPICEKKTMADADFAKKIQQDIANSLQIECVDLSSNDLLEYEKRYRLEQSRPVIPQQPLNARVARIPPELQQMSVMVKEVLPMVPLSAIYKDLVKTRNVDVTITNILEGHVRYIPEATVVTPTRSPLHMTSSSVLSTAGGSSSQSVGTSSSSSSNQPQTQQQLSEKAGGSSSSSGGTTSVTTSVGSCDPLNTAASTFGKSARERTMSFHERKQRLIENARCRYLEKRQGMGNVALQ